MQATETVGASFSLVRGGPLHRFCERHRLLGLPLVVILVGLAWVPPALLAADPAAFVGDIEVQVRILLAVPLLLFAERVAHEFIDDVPQRLDEAGLLPEEARPAFREATAALLRWRDSPVELWMIPLFPTLGSWLWRTWFALEEAGWWSDAHALSAAGWWYGLVSLPIFQFLVVRWGFRFVLWAGFVWRISRLPLVILPAHPDRAGGLGFFAETLRPFEPLLFAFGALIAAFIGNRVAFRDAAVLDWEIHAFVSLGAAILLALAPLSSFARRLDRAKVRGQNQYRAIAAKYVRRYDEHWVGHPEPVESGDVQGLAATGESFALVNRMRAVPYGRAAVVRLLVAAVIPLAPLPLIVVEPKELLHFLLEVLGG